MVAVVTEERLYARMRNKKNEIYINMKFDKIKTIKHYKNA